MTNKFFSIASCAILLILVTGNIYWTKQIADDVAAIKETAKITSNDGKNDAAKPEAKAAVPVEKNKIDLIIDESGFSPNMISVYSDEKLEISVTNNDKVARTFEIKDLGINWEPIEPGKTAKITVENLPAESQNLSFVSSDGSGDATTLEGIMMVLKK